jgi:hypothetical protein
MLLSVFRFSFSWITRPRWTHFPGLLFVVSHIILALMLFVTEINLWFKANEHYGFYVYRCTACRSQWPRGLRHEMSSSAWTLGSLVRIPLEAWMFVCVYSVFVLSCVSSGLATGWSLVQGALPTVYKCKITEPLKEEAKARYGLERPTRRRRCIAYRFFLPFC